MVFPQKSRNSIFSHLEYGPTFEKIWLFKLNIFINIKEEKQINTRTE